MKTKTAVILASVGKRELNSKKSLGLHKICGKSILNYQIDKLISEDYEKIVVAIYYQDQDLISSCNESKMETIIYQVDGAEIKDFILTSNSIPKDSKVVFYDLTFPISPIENYEINNRIDLAKCEKIMRKSINNRHMMAGVAFIDNKNSYIDITVKIGMDSIIYPGATITGDTVIGEDCIIGQNSRIENSIIGDRVEIISSVIIESQVDDETKIGPFAYLRPKSNIGKHVKIGDFVEIKNSTIGNNSKVSHLAYVGDATIGKEVNIGCGVVFVNYDGKNKFRSIVCDGAFIGSNSNVVAPVEIAERAYVAAGTTVCRDVPSGALCLGRVKEKHIEGWVDRKKLLKK